MAPTTSGSIVANLPSSATPIAATDLPSANSPSSTYTAVTSLVVYDNLGGAHTINLYLSNTGANTCEVDAFDASKAATGGGFPYSSGPLATATLTFDPTTGSLSSGSPLTIPVPNGQSMSLDLSNLTQLAAGFSVSSATANGNAPASLYARMSSPLLNAAPLDDTFEFGPRAASVPEPPLLTMLLIGFVGIALATRGCFEGPDKRSNRVVASF